MISDDVRQHIDVIIEKLDNQSIDDDGYKSYEWLSMPNIDGYKNRDLSAKIIKEKSHRLNKVDIVMLIKNFEQACQIYKILEDALHYLSIKYPPIKYPADNIGRKCLIKGGTSMPFNIMSFDENTNTTTLSSPRGKILQTKKDLFFCQRETQSIKKIQEV